MPFFLCSSLILASHLTNVTDPTSIQQASQNHSPVMMGVERIVLKAGNGVDAPKKHDEVSMEYTGWLYDDSAPYNKGTKFDTSVGRGDLITPIGVGRVIRGWDEGILGSPSGSPMTLGEKATLTISADYGYGIRGFPGHIPANSRLIFDVELKSINGKRA